MNASSFTFDTATKHFCRSVTTEILIKRWFKKISTRNFELENGSRVHFCQISVMAYRLINSA